MNLPAVRTVSESDEFRLVEGLAFPFRGRDTYRTFFSARTDFHWDLFPDVVPGAVRAESPLFIRPSTYHHGFDPDIGLSRIGGWSPVRSDADGIWVQAQIAKRTAYYEGRLKPLLDAGALGLSGGSAEHSVRIDERSGEILEWPAYELALTPVESNPLAQLAGRSGDFAEALRVVATPPAVRTAEYAGALRVVAAAGPAELVDIRDALYELAVRGWLPEGTTPADLDDGDFAWVSDDGKTRKLPYKVNGKVNEDGWRAAWTRANQDGTDFSGGPDRAAVLKKLKADKPADIELAADAAKSGTRAIQTFSDISAAVELNEELPEAFDTLTSAIYGAVYATDRDFNPLPPADKLTAIQTSLDQFRDYVLGLIDQPAAEASDTATIVRSAIRVGKRNSATDAAALQTAHDNIASVMGMDCAPDGDAARSADVEPGIRIVTEPVPTDADQALRDLATRAGEQAAARLLERL